MEIQNATVEKLIQIDCDYWNTFISGKSEDLYRDNRILSPMTPEMMIFKQDLGTTPMRMSMRSGKIYESKVPAQATTGKIFSSPVML